ncbi:MAG: hypothetical protein J5639_00520 [Bacteroidales bacterium]|nr:hypothetical protein [Bacteroidales bacterium]MBR4121413.1 hypothetical protein [Spirochaetales bacterium]
MTIAVDFDGTIVEHKYPKIGKEKPFAIDTLRSLQAEGHKLILWTAREGELLEEAIAFCKRHGLEFYAVNDSVPNGGLFSNKGSGAKLLADIYIDDRNLGGLPEWGEIYEIICHKQVSRDKKKRRTRRFRLFSR